MSQDNQEKVHQVAHESSDEEQQLASDNHKIEIVYPKGLELVLISFALCLAVFLVALDQTIIATAIPRITDHFHSVQDIGWYGSVSVCRMFHSHFDKYSLPGLLFNGYLIATYIWACL
jgi:hypothetical protein